AVARLRNMEVAKRPGVAETIDWSNSLAFLGAPHLDNEAAEATLGAVIKDHEDFEYVRRHIDDVVEDDAGRG
nr:MoxR family ATPase [Rubrobacter sp.]